ncbi:hypothetical protein OC834_005592 [Tilletia horrida]|nr:hypothetical protein OC834_005592 [Tilletia horrida]
MALPSPPLSILLPSDGRSPMAGPSQLPALHYKGVFQPFLVADPEQDASSQPDLGSTDGAGAKKKRKNGPAERIEAHLRARGWESTWRYGMYKHAHYHSTTHELLSVFQGSARIQLGGVSAFSSNPTSPLQTPASPPPLLGLGMDNPSETEKVLLLEPGDVLLLPAGYTHFALPPSPAAPTPTPTPPAEPFLMVGSYPEGSAPWDMRYPCPASPVATLAGGEDSEEKENECTRATAQIRTGLLERPRKGLFDARDPADLSGPGSMEALWAVEAVVESDADQPRQHGSNWGSRQGRT